MEITEKLYSVVMTEEEVALYSEFQKEFAKIKYDVAKQEVAAEALAGRARNHQKRVDQVVESMKKHGHTDLSQLTGKYADWVKNDENFGKTIMDNLSGGKMVSDKVQKSNRASAIAANTGSDFVAGSAKMGKTAVSDNGLDLSGKASLQTGSNVKMDIQGNQQATLVHGSNNGNIQSTVTTSGNLRKEKIARKRAKQVQTGTTVNQDIAQRMSKTRKGRHNSSNINSAVKGAQEKFESFDADKILKSRAASNPINTNVPTVVTSKPKTNKNLLNQIGKHIGKHKTAYGLGAAGIAATGVGLAAYKHYKNKNKE